MYLTFAVAGLENIQEVSKLEEVSARFTGSSNRSRSRHNQESDFSNGSHKDHLEASEIYAEPNLQEYRRCERERVRIHIIEEGIKNYDEFSEQSVSGHGTSRSGTVASHSNTNKSMVQTGEDYLYPASFQVEWNRLPLPLVMESQTQDPSSVNNHLLQPTHSLKRTESGLVPQMGGWIEESGSCSVQLLPKASTRSASEHLADTEEHENQLCSVQEQLSKCRPVNLVPLRSKFVHASKMTHC